MYYLALVLVLSVAATGCCGQKKHCPMKADSSMSMDAAAATETAPAVVEEAAPAVEAAAAPAMEAATEAAPEAAVPENLPQAQ